MRNALILFSLAVLTATSAQARILTAADFNAPLPTSGASRTALESDAATIRGNRDAAPTAPTLDPVVTPELPEDAALKAQPSPGDVPTFERPQKPSSADLSGILDATDAPDAVIPPAPPAETPETASENLGRGLSNAATPGANLGSSSGADSVTPAEEVAATPPSVVSDVFPGLSWTSKPDDSTASWQDVQVDLVGKDRRRGSLYRNWMEKTTAYYSGGIKVVTVPGYAGSPEYMRHEVYVAFSDGKPIKIIVASLSGVQNVTAKDVVLNATGGGYNTPTYVSQKFSGSGAVYVNPNHPKLKNLTTIEPWEGAYQSGIIQN